MTGAPIATVVIVNYNGAALLPSCLAALDAQREDGVDFETVVVDNDSHDDSRVLLAREYPWARVIESDVNHGFAGGNNLALQQVTTPFAVLLNNDATPERHWLRNLLAPFAEPGNHDVAIVTGKVVFLPRFTSMHLATTAFHPDSSDSRQLGVRVYAVTVDDVDVTEKTLWAEAAYGPEGVGADRYRWTRPDGDFLVPISSPSSAAGSSPIVKLTVAAERVKPFILTSVGTSTTAEVGPDRTEVTITLDPGAAYVDVLNNVGGIVLIDGSGGDRGFQEIDEGQYDKAEDVFTACGNGLAMRTAIGREIGWFDDSFFMYYEDADLSWRCRSRGWSIRYEPSARLRHIHAASSKEWSPSWRFHVERNRLLMLTKNATPALAARAVAGYLRSSAASAVGELRVSVRLRRRPATGVHLLHLRIIGSYLRLLPHALHNRVDLGRRATVSRQTLQSWLVSSR